jgi:ATP phosphoribosyltransferase regulatory subunit
MISNPRSQAALSRLDCLWSVIESLHLADRFEIDLGDVSQLDYYTGLTFKIYISGAGARVASGGRYDGLTASFGKEEPAVGFVFELDTLTEVLFARAPDSIAAGTPSVEGAQLTGNNLSELFVAARKKRELGERVVINASGVLP